MGMVKMKHVSIYGSGSDARQALELLIRLECLHPDNANDISQAAAKVSDNAFDPVLSQTTGLLKDIDASTDCLPYEGMSFKLGDIKKTVDVFSESVAKRRGRKAEIEAKLSTFEQTINQLHHLTNLHTNVDEIFACKYLKVRFGRLPKDSFAKLPYYTDKPFTFNDYDFDGEFYWGMYLVPENYAGEVDAIMASLYFERMWVPDFVHGTPQDALVKLMAEQAELEAELKNILDMSDIASADDIVKLRKMLAWLSYESQIFEMRKYVALLEQSYYISGYVPEDKLQTLQNEITLSADLKMLVDDDDAKVFTIVEPPVKLKNNKFSRPFEFYVKMYGLPSYGDLDPTAFVSITYAILFGAMFGDIGQGLVLGLIGYFVMYKMKNIEVGRILARCSFFSIFFGFIFGSLFGFEHIMEVFYHDVLGITFLPFLPMEAANINTVLIASIAAGVFVISAAMLTGVYAKMRKKDYVGSVFSANGLAGFVFYIALIAVVVKMALGINIPFVGSILFYIICIAVPFLIMYFSEPLCEVLRGHKPHEKFGEMLLNGFFEIFHVLLSFASNSMSFLRVGGFILVHAGMMSVVHTLAALTTNVILQVVIYILGNIFVIAIEGLFVAIQVLRLEFFEIFSRFFDANGKPFEPLKIR